MLEIASKGEPMSFSRPVAIVILPLAGLFFERDLDEPVTGLFGPALYILYVVGVLAFGALFVGQERLSPAATSIAAGSLLSGSLIVGFKQSSAREQHASYCSCRYLFLPLPTFQLIELLPLRAPWWLRWCFCHLGSRRKRWVSWRQGRCSRAVHALEKS